MEPARRPALSISRLSPMSRSSSGEFGPEVLLWLHLKNNAKHVIRILHRFVYLGGDVV